MRIIHSYLLNKRFRKRFHNKHATRIQRIYRRYILLKKLKYAARRIRKDHWASRIVSNFIRSVRDWKRKRLKSIELIKQSMRR